MSSQFLLILVSTITCISALQQFLTFYSLKQLQGDSVTFRTNIGDLGPFLNSIITTKSSYQVLGWWSCFSKTNYEGHVENFFGGNKFIVSGDNSDNDNEPDLEWGELKSCRHHGALNTETIGLSLYSNPKFEGIEQFTSGPCFVLNSPALSFMTSGKSNWTFYEGSNFNGSSKCITSNEKNDKTDVIRSVRIGC